MKRKFFKLLLSWFRDNYIVRIIITIILLYILFSRIANFSDILKTFKSVNPYLFIPFLIFYFIALSIGGLNLFLLFRKIKKDVSFKKIFKYYLFGWGFGSITMGKVGEFFILPFLKKEKIKYGESLAVLIIDKIITIIVLAIVATITLLFLLKSNQFYKLILLILVLAFGLLLIRNEYIRKIIKKIISKKAADELKKFNKTLNIFLSEQRGVLIINFILTFLKWILSGVATYFVFLSLGYEGNFIWIILISISLTIISLIPFTVNGIGIREIVAVYVYNLINIPAAVVVSAYLILLIVMCLFSIVFIVLNRK